MSLLLDTLNTSPNANASAVLSHPRRASPRKATFEKIAVIGLGYVGLPLAVCLAQKFAAVTGLDIAQDRIDALRGGLDSTHEVNGESLRNSGLRLTSDASDLARATFYIITVPTPITAAHQPDLGPLKSACRTIAPHLRKGDIVVLESTVYPGVTEDICGRMLADLSGLTAGVDFNLGYSPERINPGDKVNTVEKIIKIVSADTPAALARISDVYGAVIEAGLYHAPSIKVAEGAKVLENTQRDVNIALMNELSLICDKIGIAATDVIAAAATKWNFVPFTPGLVGGHCIGVDPYYLASLAEQVGHHPEVILAGRRLNDSMASHVANTALRLLIQQGGTPRKSRIGVFGLSFKENVPDIRNSKALEVVQILRTFGLDPLVIDPLCDPFAAQSEGIKLCNENDAHALDMMVLTTPHGTFLDQPDFLGRIKSGGILVDVRGSFRSKPRPDDLTYWTL